MKLNDINNKFDSENFDHIKNYIIDNSQFAANYTVSKTVLRQSDSLAAKFDLSTRVAEKVSVIQENLINNAYFHSQENKKTSFHVCKIENYLYFLCEYTVHNNQYADLQMTKLELNNMFSIVNYAAAKFDIYVSSNVCTPICVVNPKDYPLIQFGHCSANIINRPITLDIKGNIRVCNHSPVIVGNIYVDSIETILTSEYIDKWFNTIPDYCKDCKLFYKCMAGCRAASEQLGFGLDKEDPLIEQVMNKEKVQHAT